MGSPVTGTGAFTQEPPVTSLLPRPSWSLPEDIRVPWDWIDLIIFALLSMGGTFAVSVILVFAFSSFHVSMAQLRASAPMRTYFAVLNQMVLSFALLRFMAVQIRTRADVPFWRTLGWRRL